MRRVLGEQTSLISYDPNKVSGETEVNKKEGVGEEGRRRTVGRLGVGACQTFQLMIPMVSLVSRDCFIPLIGEFKVGRVGLLVRHSMLAQLGESCLVSIQCRALGSLSKPSIWEGTTADVVL